MNVLNQLVMIVIALLLFAVPALLLFVTFGVVSADTINTYTGYQSAVDALGGLSLSSLGTAAKVIAGIAGVVVALLILALIMRELTGGKLVARSTLIQEDPGRETRITASAVRTLSNAAAREVGALSPQLQPLHA